MALTLAAGWSLVATAQTPATRGTAPARGAAPSPQPARGAAPATQNASQTPLPLEPQRQSGQSVTPAYEGWYENADGSFSLLLGYYNRNSQQTFDIPVGPNNKIEPGPADQGQPTHFESGRQWGVFVVKVPKDFGNKAVTWTIVSNGETQTIPFTLSKGYPISPMKDLGMGNEPPKLSFSQGGPQFQGPPLVTATTLTGKVNTPIAVNVWVEDPKDGAAPAQGSTPAAAPAPAARAAGGGGRGGGRGGRGGAAAAGGGAAATGRGGATVATLSMHKFRGPGKVTFDKTRLTVPTQGAMVSANATFSEPGDYLLRVQANDESGEGGGGFQCCWTNAYVKVTVQP
ncbi:MAG: hypothetical protein LBQ09_08385 [Acidobacteriaceae bacterium]|jgi:hypothetical protein|nr:hypothetical protein [Acidobacteriaceae bacterium]